MAGNTCLSMQEHNVHRYAVPQQGDDVLRCEECGHTYPFSLLDLKESKRRQEDFYATVRVTRGQELQQDFREKLSAAMEDAHRRSREKRGSPPIPPSFDGADSISGSYRGFEEFRGN